MKKKIIVVAAHPDDEIIGCGGTLIKHIKSKDSVRVIFASESENARNTKKNISSKRSLIRQKIAKKVSKFLSFEEPIFLGYPNLELTRQNITQMNKQLKEIFEKFKPNIIYTHTPYDLHHDHRKTFEATSIAIRPNKNFMICKFLTFEIPSASEISNSPNKTIFIPNYFVNIESEIKTKLKILSMYYKNEMNSYPNTRSLDGINNLSKYRGNCVFLKYAEAFELIRELNI
jgi:LmbE family N-acetylglucosaminyl deacetylase